VNNVIEFLGMAISVMILLAEASEENKKEFPCLLVPLGDGQHITSYRGVAPIHSQLAIPPNIIGL
jgi:hypothetical protein